MEAPPRRDPYVIEVDKGRNCYTCGGFGHLAHHCRNQGEKIVKGRRIEYNGEREELFEYESNLKGRGELRYSQLSSHNKFSVLATEINAGTSVSEGTKKEVRKVEIKILREVTVKIRLERIDIQEGIMIEALLESGVMGLVISSKFAKKQGFKLKRLERPMQVRNVDGLFNKKGPIEHMVEVNIYFRGHRERTEINVIRRQKWMVILGMLWLARHNPEIDWRTGKVKMTRCPKECGKQWRPTQGKLGWERQKEEEVKEEAGRKQEEKDKKKK